MPSRSQLAYLGEALGQMEAQGVRTTPPVLSAAQQPRTRVNDREIINLSSNDYLGLCNHPKLRAAAIAATQQLGVGAGAVRPICGTMNVHVELERRLAAFKHTEAAVVFQSGFTANSGTVGALMGRDDVIISDALNHASIIDGARLSRATIRVFPHKDVAAAAALLQAAQGHGGRTLLITDGVFSMDGDIAPLPALCALAERYGAIMMVDDAHASGVLGHNGRGTIDHFGLHGRVDVQVGTLSKAFGVLGGYVAGSAELIEFLRLRGRPFLFSTAHPPAVAAAALAALDILEQEPERIERLWTNTRLFQSELKGLGFNTGASETPITPILIGAGRRAMTFSHALLEAGLLITGIAFPTVAEGQARLRAMVSAAHTQADLRQALQILARVGRKQGII